jgi:hypothetical protein
MRKLIILLGSISLMSVCSFDSIDKVEWGFFGHRLINRTAVYTLPPQLYGFYKRHIKFIEYESIAPDKRRYAAKGEAIRHYIDLDHWDDYDRLINRRHRNVIFEFADIKITSNSNRARTIRISHVDSIVSGSIESRIYEKFTEQWVEILGAGSINLMLDSGEEVAITDMFSEHGILPYNLGFYARRLEQAFLNRNVQDILRYSAEIGHYISDAHVPLHTTKNYNGQLTGQDGIHAFWESRIPELFALEQYDLFVDKAVYIEDFEEYFWAVVLDTHSLVDDVLDIEKQLSETWPKDQQYCYDERGVTVSRQPCSEYAAAYQDAMQDMVETQMRKSIHALGSIWFTAWVNGGQPTLDEYQFNTLINVLNEGVEEHGLRKSNK